MDVHVSLEGRTGLAGEIYQQLRRAIIDGRLRPGDCLPASRELAQRLSVSRTTVTVAYDRLSGEGFVTCRVGAGTFVSGDLPATMGRPARDVGALRPRPVWDEITPPTGMLEPAELDFRSGAPDADLFPYETWRRLTARELRASRLGRVAHGEAAGHAGLRAAIARHVGVSRGVLAEADDVTVTNGTQQALDIIARVLLAPGDRVAVESPGYLPPRQLFASLGLDVVPVPVDSQGLVVDQLPDDVRMVYVTPSHQYPLGYAMSLPRRLALLAWAQTRDVAIVEDDYDSEFRFGGRPIEPLHSLDPSGRVVYVGSFSKTMLVGLRLGFVITPVGLREAVHAAKYVSDWHAPLPTQAAMARFIDEGWLARHLRRMRTVYQARHAELVQGLTEHFKGVLEVVPSSAGLHISALAPGATLADIDAVVEQARSDGVAVQPLPLFTLDGRPRTGLILGYGGIAVERIPEGLRRLRRCFPDGDR